MICARIVSNNDPRDVEIDGIVLASVTQIMPDAEGNIVLLGKDMALDRVKLVAPFGRTIEIYH